MIRKVGTSCNAKVCRSTSFPRVARLARTRLPPSRAPRNWRSRRAGYATIAGWVETKLASYRVQDRADVVQVIKATTPAKLRKIRKRLDEVHAIYFRRFEELFEAAKEEMEQERERGGDN